jgi:hypothetical protein
VKKGVEEEKVEQLVQRTSKTEAESPKWRCKHKLTLPIPENEM